nr:pyridoxamine 5'-phosphate oxidase family protein [Nocardia australiensis]
MLDPSTIALADFPGNKQFVTTGNLDANDRVALFFIDYPTRARIKIYGRAEIVERTDNPELIQRLLTVPGGVMDVACERAFVIHVEAFNLNCSRNIPTKYSAERMRESLRLARAARADEIEELQVRNKEMAEEIARLRALVGES